MKDDGMEDDQRKEEELRSSFPHQQSHSLIPQPRLTTHGGNKKNGKEKDQVRALWRWRPDKHHARPWEEAPE